MLRLYAGFLKIYKCYNVVNVLAFVTGSYTKILLSEQFWLRKIIGQNNISNLHLSQQILLKGQADQTVTWFNQISVSALHVNKKKQKNFLWPIRIKYEPRKYLKSWDKHGNFS